MSQRTNTRLTFEMPAASHKKLKMVATYYGKTMREILNELIEDGLDNYEERYEACLESHEPNETTKQAIEDARKKKGSRKFASVEDLFKKLSE